jgi:hypothetical protein
MIVRGQFKLQSHNHHAWSAAQAPLLHEVRNAMRAACERRTLTSLSHGSRNRPRVGDTEFGTCNKIVVRFRPQTMGSVEQRCETIPEYPRGTSRAARLPRSERWSLGRRARGAIANGLCSHQGFRSSARLGARWPSPVARRPTRALRVPPQGRKHVAPIAPC